MARLTLGRPSAGGTDAVASVDGVLEPAWEAREKLILRAIVDAEETGADVNRAARTAVELDNKPYMLCIDRLARADYIDAEVSRNAGNEISFVNVYRSTPAALREVNLWPASDSLQALVDLFEALAEQEPDAERKGRFRSVADALRNLLAFGADVAGAVQGRRGGLPLGAIILAEVPVATA